MVYPKLKAKIDSSMRRVIGHDIFYFSNATAKRLFDRDPLRYVKALSDPVTNDRFMVTRTSPREEYRERVYYFASTGEKSTFDGNREKFRDRRATTMLELD